MADFISPWMPEHAGGRVVDMDILKGQQVMSEMAQVPSKIQLAQAHAQYYQTQALRAKEQMETDRQTREALQRLSAQAAGVDWGMEENSGEANRGGTWRNPLPGDQLTRAADALFAINPKLSGQLRVQGSLVNSRSIRDQKDALRANQYALQSQNERLDLAGRRMQGVTTLPELLDEARNYEKLTGMSTGLFGDDGSNPTVNFTKGGVQGAPRDVDAENRFAVARAKELADATMKRKDMLAQQDREAQRRMVQAEYDSRDQARRDRVDADLQKKLAEARRKPASEKAGEERLTVAERKEGADYIKAMQPNAGDRISTLGDELMERAKRLKAQKGGTLAEAKEEIYKRMRTEPSMMGIPGSGRNPYSPKEWPLDKDGNADKSKIEKNTWYRYGNSIKFWDGEMLRSPEYMRNKQLGPRSSASDVINASDDSGDEDDDTELKLDDDDEED